MDFRGVELIGRIRRKSETPSGVVQLVGDY